MKVRGCYYQSGSSDYKANDQCLSEWFQLYWYSWLKQIGYECYELLFYPRLPFKRFLLALLILNTSNSYYETRLWLEVTQSAHSYSTESIRKESSWVTPGFTSLACSLLHKNYSRLPTENKHFHSIAVIMACLFLIIVSHD